MVKILDREYRIACDADERRQLLDAADYLDKHMRQLRDGSTLLGAEKIAVLAALNISSEFLQIKQREDQLNETLGISLNALGEKLDQGLQQFSTPPPSN